jgi:hypothetical protein
LKLLLGINMATRYQLAFNLVFFVSFFSTESLALSAVTTNVIEGHSPRFITSIENSIESNAEFDYFGVTYDGKTYFNTNDLDSALGINIATKTPVSLKLSSAIKQPQNTDVIDVDGDGDISLSEDTAHPLSLVWYYEDSDNNEVKLTAAQTTTTFSTLLKNGIYPYIKVSGSVSLNTKYGVPNSQNYPDNKIAITKTPYRRFHIKIGGEAIKYASPNMSYAGGGYTYGDKSIFDPTTNNGHVPQSDYLDNFPSTGANGLYFYLVTNGIDNSLDTTTWAVKTSNVDDSSLNAITASIEKTEAPSSKGFKVYDNKNMVLVTLKGPDSSSKGEDKATAPTANLPVDIELIGTTKQGVKLTYKFRITQWFINRGDFVAWPAQQKEWCEGLGNYRQANVRDLSNARLNSLSDNFHPHHNYKRAVHQGLLTEWGAMAYFSGANFYNQTYGWTSGISPSNGNVIYVNMNTGALYDNKVTTKEPSYDYYGICVAK